MMYMTSSARNTSMRRISKAMTRMERSIGSLTRKVCCHQLAPSMREASSTSEGNAWRPAMTMMKMKGVHCQMSVRTIAKNARSGTPSHTWGSRPNQRPR